jgi:hypothetical protein
MTQNSKTCENCSEVFVITRDDFSFYEKVKVPPPTFCPECREQRRNAFRNERSLYKRKCDLCGEEIVSRVSSDKSYPTYCQKCWWSDKWDARDYGREYDLSRSFFEQFRELLFSTPHISLLNTNTVNSEWVNQESDVKNCYLEFGGHFNEDSAYNIYLLHSRDCFDNYWVIHSELCYECINCERCHKTLFSEECHDCRDTILSYDCRNCSNVFGSAGLRSKQYYIFNKPHTKEEYKAFIKENPLTSYSAIERLREQAYETRKSVPHRFRHALKSANVTGNRIVNSKNVHNAWNTEESEDSKHPYITLGLKDCWDMTSVAWSELCYEGGHSGGLYNSKFFAYNFGGGVTVDKINCSNLEYCYTAPSSNDCFGCVNLKKGQYCILNKQYSKEEYKELIPKIRKHMDDMPYVGKASRTYRYGEFFPTEISPFSYNETTAQDYFPLTKEEALRRGYLWSDYVSNIKYEFSDYKIPDNVSDVQDDILEKTLKCEVSRKAYRIVPMELRFYRRTGLPIPRKSPHERHRDRMQQLLPRVQFDRTCQCAGKTSNSQPTTNKSYTNTAEHFHGSEPCPNEFQTSYAPDRPEIVYCEACYTSEVV